MLKPGPTKAIFRRPRSNPNQLSQELAGSGIIIDNYFLIMFNKNTINCKTHTNKYQEQFYNKLFFK